MELSCKSRGRKSLKNLARMAVENLRFWFHFTSLFHLPPISPLIQSAPRLKVSNWSKISSLKSFEKFFRHKTGVEKFAKLFPYTNHSSLVVLLVCGKSWPIRDLRWTEGPSIDVVSKHKLKFLGIVWFPFIPFSPNIIFSDGSRVAWSRGNVECFEPFVAIMFVW